MSADRNVTLKSAQPAPPQYDHSLVAAKLEGDLASRIGRKVRVAIQMMARRCETFVPM